jgi:phosphohistidine phosphatase
MKEIILMRHAKSSWKEADLKDIDRPLNKRGKKDAHKMGELLKDKEVLPDRIFSSPAKRARLTAETIAKTVDFSDDVIYMDDLYLAEPDVFMDILKTQSDEICRIMFVGHNPGMEWLLQMLCGEVVSLPTAALAHIQLPVEHWHDLDTDVDGELISRWKPKDTSDD